MGALSPIGAVVHSATGTSTVEIIETAAMKLCGCVEAEMADFVAVAVVPGVVPDIGLGAEVHH